MKFPFVLGRLAFGGFFLYNGIRHFRNRDAMAQYTASKHVPMPGAAVEATGALLIAGGVSMMTGLAPTLGAAAIVTFLAGVSPVMHNFWRHSDPNERQNQIAHFSKNMALVGAAVALGFAAERRESGANRRLLEAPASEEVEVEQLV